ncbi:Hypothetical protein R9X50_00145500 [Acrodontium crateriforme]|uniref:LisH domain-containing protein n=1 Tax=Acrodontium crateriforme TaxID=150365 RepID=A0AAQ3RA33_9PEZI|nr:Hypothetical protein R9X50_00145500 [Acrodontium crateriforme]
MPPKDSTALIVARFLKSNNYNESYDAFIAEAGLPSDAGTVAKGDLILETLLEEKKAFDLSSQFERLGMDEDEDRSWRQPAPSVAEPLQTLPSRSNILSIGAQKSTVFVTSADRQLHILDSNARFHATSLTGMQDSPILCCKVWHDHYLLTGSMSGQLILSDFSGHVFEKRRDHSKYIVQIATYYDDFIATAGWDNKISIYRPLPSVDGQPCLGDVVSTIVLPSKPEAMIFIQDEESRQPILLVSRTDSSFLYYYTVNSEPHLVGRQNLAPHSNAWVAFTPSAFALCPTDTSLLAVALSTVPHMKLAIIRLLVPPYHQTTTSGRDLQSPQGNDNLSSETQASQARAALAIADREEAAILVHCNTLAPQTAYSTPAVVWRPNGTGVWVNGDDGVVRGIESVTGKIVTTLHGHDVGSKVRCLWAGNIGKDGEEILLSGGFDQKLIAWKIPQ